METCAKSNNKNSDRESGDGKREGSLVLLLLMLLLLLCVLVDEEERLVVARVRVLGLAGEVGGREGPVPVAVADAAVAVVAVGARTRRRHQQLLAPLLALVQKVPQQKEQQIRLAVACQRQKKNNNKKTTTKINTEPPHTRAGFVFSYFPNLGVTTPTPPAPSNYPREGQRTQKLARRPGAVFPKLGVTTPDPILLPAVEVKSHRNSNKGRYCVSQTGVATPYLLPLNYPTWGRTENQTRAGFGISQTWGHDPDLRLAPSTPTPVGSSPTNEEPPLQSRAWNPVFLFNHKCDRDTLIRNETPKKNSK